MKTIEMRVWFTYDDDLMYDTNSEEDEFEYFLTEMLYNGKHILLSEDDGDLGTIEIIEVDMCNPGVREFIGGGI